MTQQLHASLTKTVYKYPSHETVTIILPHALTIMGRDTTIIYTASITSKDDSYILVVDAVYILCNIV